MSGLELTPQEFREKSKAPKACLLQLRAGADWETVATWESPAQGSHEVSPLNPNPNPDPDPNP